MINSLHLQQFKNFDDTTLSLGPVTVIVGTNASGKSNLRDAFRFIHGISRDYSLADIVGEKFVEGTLQWRGIRGGSREVASFGQSSFSLEVWLPWQRRNVLVPKRYRYRITVEVSRGSRPLRVIAESLYRNGKIVFDSHPERDAPAQEGPQYLLARLRQVGDQRRRGYGVRFLSDQPVLSQLASHNDVPKEVRDYGARALAQIRSMRFLDLSPEAMKQPSLPGQPLGDRGENLSSALQVICEDSSTKQAMAEWIRELTPLDVTDFEFVPDETGRIVVTLVEANGQRTSVFSASDGTLRFLAMIAARTGPDAAQFYFLEEIDNGIHPTRLNLLLQLIEQRAGEGKVQIVTTTHSPQLLAMLSDEVCEHAFLVYRLKNETGGRIRRIMSIPSARDVLKRQNLSRLHESGWLENVIAFSQPEGAPD